MRFDARAWRGHASRSAGEGAPASRPDAMRAAVRASRALRARAVAHDSCAVAGGASRRHGSIEREASARRRAGARRTRRAGASMSWLKRQPLRSATRRAARRAPSRETPSLGVRAQDEKPARACAADCSVRGSLQARLRAALTAACFEFVELCALVQPARSSAPRACPAPACRAARMSGVNRRHCVSASSRPRRSTIGGLRAPASRAPSAAPRSRARAAAGRGRRMSAQELRLRFLRSGERRGMAAMDELKTEFWGRP